MSSEQPTVTGDRDTVGTVSVRSGRTTRSMPSGALPALPTGRIGRTLQLGISASALTAELAARCGALLVVDDDLRAVRSSRHRYRSLAHVRFDSCRGPQTIPVGPFSLIVCSGLFARWDRASISSALRRVEAGLEPGGSLLAIHERKSDLARILGGEELHELLGEGTRLRHVHGETHQGYLLDRWQLDH